MEGVGILHQELPGAHHPETGTHLVAELGLDLVEVGRQLFVALYFAAYEIGDHLFVGGTETELPIVPVGEPQQFRSVLLPAAGLLPQLCRLDGGHQQLLRASPIHLLPHDVFHLAQHPQPEGQPGIEPRGEATDHAGAQHQLVADHFGIGRGFPQGGEKQSGGAHGIGLPLDVVEY